MDILTPAIAHVGSTTTTTEAVGVDVVAAKPPFALPRCITKE
jgi:hypothetical protein